MSIGLVCDFALFKHAPLACMRWICLCMAKRFTHERPSALTLPTDVIPRDWYNSSLQANWLTRFNPHSNTPLQRAGAFALHVDIFIRWFCCYCCYWPSTLGCWAYIIYISYTLLKKVSTPSIDASLDAGYMFISILLLMRWYPTFGGSIMVTRSLFHFRSLTSDRFVLIKFSSLRCLLVSSWLGNPWSAESPGSDHRHFFCCTTS